MKLLGHTPPSNSCTSLIVVKPTNPFEGLSERFYLPQTSREQIAWARFYARFEPYFAAMIDLHIQFKPPKEQQCPELLYPPLKS